MTDRHHHKSKMDTAMTKMLLATVCLGMLLSNSTMAQVTAKEDVEKIYNYVEISDQLGTAGQPAYDQIKSLKDEGYEVIVNLATAAAGMNELEGFLATEEGITYVHIPVPWREPGVRDLEMFFAVMDANKDRKVFVHCMANMRASAFTYLYRTLKEGVPDEQALADMHKVWDPMELEQWARLVNDAKAKYAGRED